VTNDAEERMSGARPPGPLAEGRPQEDRSDEQCQALADAERKADPEPRG
jgi:hypothetical protein